MACNCEMAVDLVVGFIHTMTGVTFHSEGVYLSSSLGNSGGEVVEFLAIQQRVVNYIVPVTPI